MNETRSDLDNKDIVLFYLRHCLREIGSGLYDQENNKVVDILINELRDAILYVETKCPKD